jgi:YaiO family outer membrane protein
MPVVAQLPPSPPSVSAPAQPVATPTFDDAYARARALANGGQPGLALAAYDALLARSPGNVDVLLGRGIVYARLGRWTEAESDLRAAAAASPAYVDAWSALGNMYLWSGQQGKARAAYSRLIALQPNDPAAYAALAAALQPRAGSPDAAIAAGYTWAAGVSSSWTDAGPGPRWNDQTISVRHYTKAGSLAFETLRAHRFGRQDVAWALDGYVNLWSGAYANVRYQRGAAARLFPANAGRAELLQSLGNGWEASVSDDVLGYAARVNIYGVAIAKYTGDWYLQLRHQNIVSAGARGTGERLLARWYYAGDADTYAEVAVNSGRSDDPLSLVGGRNRSGGGSAAWVRYWTPAWGTRMGANFSRAGGADNQRGVTFALYRRW